MSSLPASVPPLDGGCSDVAQCDSGWRPSSCSSSAATPTAASSARRSSSARSHRYRTTFVARSIRLVVGRRLRHVRHPARPRPDRRPDGGVGRRQPLLDPLRRARHRELLLDVARRLDRGAALHARRSHSGRELPVELPHRRLARRQLASRTARAVRRDHSARLDRRLRGGRQLRGRPTPHPAPSWSSGTDSAPCCAPKPFAPRKRRTAARRFEHRGSTLRPSWGWVASMP